MVILRVKDFWRWSSTEVVNDDKGDEADFEVLSTILVLFNNALTDVLSFFADVERWKHVNQLLISFLKFEHSL